MSHAETIPATVAPTSPQIRTITPSDLRDALMRGLDDFRAMPSHAVFLCVIYPVIGLVLGRLAFGYDIVPLLYPLAAGFALVGPFAAVGLYELSRRREKGLDSSWTHVFDIFRSPSFSAIAALGLFLVVLFLVWVATAHALYVATIGHIPAASIPNFIERVFTTEAGWTLIIVGNGVGFLFALAVLLVSAVSFPMLVDRPVGAAMAVTTSIRAVMANPGPMALWGLIVAALLALGSIPCFIGLAFVMPLLGHATWHLYRKLVV